MNGTLYLVSVPIGDDEDITYRALRILKETSVVVFEERKTGLRFLATHGLSGKQTESLNEHNEQEMTGVIMEYLSEGKDIALISDAGTPVFSDPGRLLVGNAVQKGVRVIPVPGVSSIVPALITSGFFIDEFVFCGFLSPKAQIRRTQLSGLLKETRVMVLMDTPYRLAGLVRDIAEVFGRQRRIAVAFNLTLPDEQILRGWPDEVSDIIEKQRMKGEFVVVIDGLRGRSEEKMTRPEDQAPEVKSSSVSK